MRNAPGLRYSSPLMEATAMDLTLTAEDLAWLLKLHGARAANQFSADIPTSVVRKLTGLACAEAGGGGCALTRIDMPRAIRGTGAALTGAGQAGRELQPS